MKTVLLLALLASVSANFEEEGANRRHTLVNRVHRRLEETPATEDAMSIQLTRNPTTAAASSGSKRVTPKRPSASPAAAAAKTEGITGDERKGNGNKGNSKREEAKLAETEAPTTTAMPTTYPPTLEPSTLSPTGMPTTYYPTLSPSYYPTMGSGKSRKINMDDYDDDALLSKSGKGGKAGGAGGKSGKAVIEKSIDYCEKSFEKAWEANIEADKAIAETRTELKEQCAFDTTDTKKSPFAPNLQCPFIYTPDTGFLDEKEEVIEYFENITGSNETGIAFWEFQNYCSCVSGLNEECVTKIPDIPPIDETALDYCIFASIWNGDVELDLLDTLPSEVEECGCTFVMSEKEEVSECPGLDLGGNFIDPLE